MKCALNVMFTFGDQCLYLKQSIGRQRIQRERVGTGGGAVGRDNSEGRMEKGTTIHHFITEDKEATMCACEFER